MLPEINLTHLRYFTDAARLKSISLAARDNFVSQSAISQGIAKLEQALQRRLITHQRQIFRLTEDGELVLEESKRIFASVESLKERLKEHAKEISGPVVFGCTNAIAQFFLPPIYLKMRQKHPNVQLKFHRGSLHFLQEALKNEKVRFFIALDAREFYDYQQKVLYKGYFRLYKARGAKSSTIKTRSLLVDHATNPEIITLRQRYQERYGKQLPIREELSGWAMVATFIQMGLGEGYLPDFIMHGNPNIQEVTLDLPLIEYQISAFWLKGRPLSVADKAFLEIV